MAVQPAPLTLVVPAPPATLATERQKQIWNDLVLSRPLGYFDRAGLHLVAELVLHLSLFETASHEINSELSGDRDHDRLNALSILRARESKSAASLSAKLRLCPSSVLSQATGRTAFEKGGPRPRPWE
jgi:hypothetical protein